MLLTSSTNLILSASANIKAQRLYLRYPYIENPAVLFTVKVYIDPTDGSVTCPGCLEKFPDADRAVVNHLCLFFTPRTILTAGVLQSHADECPQPPRELALPWAQRLEQMELACLGSQPGPVMGFTSLRFKFPSFATVFHVNAWEIGGAFTCPGCKDRFRANSILVSSPFSLPPLA